MLVSRKSLLPFTNSWLYILCDRDIGFFSSVPVYRTKSLCEIYRLQVFIDHFVKSTTCCFLFAIALQLSQQTAR